jgi:hypothetical protein
MPTLTLLLPASERLPGGLPSTLAKALGRADWQSRGEAGGRAQLQRHFDILPRGWPVAALTRELDVGDAAGAVWLRADPAWLRPDINGARLMACGERLQPTQADVDALLPALRPVFGDAGFALDAPDPSRWYLRVPTGSTLPAFADPEDALGADLFEFMTRETDAAARRWRALDSEVQVTLHNHPWNARRLAAGKPPINALWFWGAGALPAAVQCGLQTVLSDDVLVNALARAAGIEHATRPSVFADPAGATLVDLRDARDIGRLSGDWLEPALQGVRRGAVSRLVLDFGDGRAASAERSQRWRVWRKPIASFPQPSGGHVPT